MPYENKRFAGPILLKSAFEREISTRSPVFVPKYA